jgi:hypothetical protein
MTLLSLFADLARLPKSWSAPNRSDLCGRGSINRIASERPLPAKSPKSIPFYAATEEEAHAAAAIEFKIDMTKVRLLVRPA